VSGLHVGAEVKFTTTQQQSAGAVDAQQVSYVPPFTGSVPTNVEAKLAQTVSVQDFGAVGNGVADDTLAIQAAIDYVNSIGGGTVYLTGEHFVTDSIVMKANVRLSGYGCSIFCNTSSAFEAVTTNISALVSTTTTAPAGIGATAVSVASASGFSVGDVILIDSTTEYYNTLNVEWKKSQWNIVTDIVGNSIGLLYPLDLFYLASTTRVVKNVQNNNIVVEGFKCYRQSPQTTPTLDGIFINNVFNFVARDLQVWNFYSNVTINTGLQVTLDSNAVGFCQYSGLILGQVDYGQAVNNRIYDCTQGIAGGSAGVARHLVYSNNVISSRDIAMDMHVNVDSGTMIGNSVVGGIVWGAPNGVCANNYVESGNISSTNDAAILIDSEIQQSLKGLVFEGNVIKSAGHGILFPANNLTLPVKSLAIRNNITTGGIFVVLQSSSTFGFTNLDISNNTVDSIVYLRDITVSVANGNVNVNGNISNGIECGLSEMSALTVSHNTVNANGLVGAYGIRVFDFNTSATKTINVVVNDNAISTTELNGISVANCLKSTVIGNTLFNCGATGTSGSSSELCGIAVAASVDFSVIQNNYIDTTKFYGYYVDAAAGVVENNVVVNITSGSGVTAFPYYSSGISPTRSNSSNSASATPTNGYWAVGSLVWNTGVTAGGSPGWICTTAGTPGTWKTMANLGA
jgi:hypothetical protein